MSRLHSRLVACDERGVSEWRQGLAFVRVIRRGKKTKRKNALAVFFFFVALFSFFRMSASIFPIVSVGPRSTSFLPLPLFLKCACQSTRQEGDWERGSSRSSSFAAVFSFYFFFLHFVFFLRRCFFVVWRDDKKEKTKIQQRFCRRPQRSFSWLRNLSSAMDDSYAISVTRTGDAEVFRWIQRALRHNRFIVASLSFFFSLVDKRRRDKANNLFFFLFFC